MINEAEIQKAKDPRQMWETPPEFFKVLDDEFDFDIDIAATKANRKCGSYISLDGFFSGRSSDYGQINLIDSLHPDQNWFNCGSESAFGNPPFGNILPFAEQASVQVNRHRKNAVLVTNMDNSTKWFHYMVEHAYELRLPIGFYDEDDPNADGSAKWKTGRVQFMEAGSVEASSNNKAQAVWIFRRKPVGQKCYINTYDWRTLASKSDLETE